MNFGIGGFGFSGTGGGGGGGIAAVTANNGIIANTISNVQWGGTLIKDTTVTAVGFDIIFTGSKASDADFVLLVTNSSTGSGIEADVTDGVALSGLSVDGNAIEGTTITGIGVQGRSTDSIGVRGVSTNGVGVSGSSTASLGGNFGSRDAGGIYASGQLFSRVGVSSQNGTSVSEVLRLYRSDAAASPNTIGSGLSFTFYTQDTTGVVVNTASLSSVYENVTAGAERASFNIATVNAGALSIKATIKGAGQLQLLSYGSGTFTGTTAFVLCVDGTGNIIESSIASLINLQNAYDGGNTINGFTFLVDDTNNLFGTTSGVITSGTDIVGFGFKAADQNTGDAVNAFGNTAASLNSGSNINALGTNAAVNNIGSNVNALGSNAGADNTADNVNFIGNGAGNLNTGRYLNALGADAGLNNAGVSCNFFGFKAGEQNTGSSVNCFGPNTGSLNSGDNADLIGAGAGTSNSGADVVAIGRDAGWDGLNGNTLSSVFIISNNVLQSFASHAAAAAAFAGGVAGNTYLYFNSATNQISGVRF